MRSSLMTGLLVVSATLVAGWAQNSLAESFPYRGWPHPAYPVIATGNVSSLNFSVYNYAAKKLGLKVGDGECTSLVSEALKAAGAKNFSELSPTGNDVDYVWGSIVATITPQNKSTSNITSGDIIQFRDISTYKEMTYPDGSWRYYSSNYNRHTAIVKGVFGSKIYVLHQNVADSSKGSNPKKIVQNGVIDVNDITSGTMRVYRPIADNSN